MKDILKYFNRFWILLGRISSYKKTVVLFIGLLAFVCCAFVGFKRGLPVPKIHDEFSYLLAADTFASGRLTNPTHPMWRHFESMHVLQKPTYMSKYPPMQGIFLAIGQKYLGHPIVGVWLSMSLMCAAICWMLQAWVSSRWALIGGLIVIFHPALGAAGYWAQSYWGGAVAGLGGAMVFGSIRRIARRGSVFDSVIMGLGIATLVNSRPFEGIIVIIPVFVLIFYWILFSKKFLRNSYIPFVLLPLFIIGLLTMAAMGYYNKTVTGNTFQMPYTVYENTYSSAPVFVWQELRLEPSFNNKQMRDFNQQENVSDYKYYSGNINFSRRVYERFVTVILPGITADSFFILPLLLSLCSLFYESKWLIFAYSIILWYGFIQSFSIWLHFHYLGPIAALFIVLIVYGYRILFCLRIRKVLIGKVVTISYLFLVVYFGFTQMAQPPNQSIWKGLDDVMNQRTFFDNVWYKQRQKIICYLNAIGGKHLILVKYSSPLHSIYNEWVYNAADIDKAPIVWARDLGDKSNQELFNYFKDRQIWYLIINNEDDTLAEFIEKGEYPNLKRALNLYQHGGKCNACL